MSALGERAAKAQHDLAEIEKALSRTQTALHVVENVDSGATEATRRRRPILTIILILTLIGIAVVVARKLLGGDDTSPVQLSSVEERSSDDASGA